MYTYIQRFKNSLTKYFKKIIIKREKEIFADPLLEQIVQNFLTVWNNKKNNKEGKNACSRIKKKYIYINGD